MINFPHPTEVELEFFNAMRDGYAADAPKKTIELLLGSKVITYENGFYQVRDIYYATPGTDRSAGNTMIWYKGIPVWTMSYQGHYTKESIPFLKKALCSCYEGNIFAGGRGPEQFKDENGWVYRNEVHPGSTFANFRGREVILRNGNMAYGGRHTYQGMLLYP